MITTRIQKTFFIVKGNPTFITSSGKDAFNRNDVSYSTYFFYIDTLASVKSFPNTNIHSHTPINTYIRTDTQAKRSGKGLYIYVQKMRKHSK